MRPTLTGGSGGYSVEAKFFFFLSVYGRELFLFLPSISIRTCVRLDSLDGGVHGLKEVTVLPWHREFISGFQQTQGTDGSALLSSPLGSLCSARTVHGEDS